MGKKNGGKKTIKWKPLILSLIIVYLFGFISSLFITQNSSLYESVKPKLIPPNFVFIIVWNVLYLFVALSLYAAWTSTNDHLQKNSLMVAFGENIILLTLWNIVFFGIYNIKIAFFNVILICISICVMMYITWEIEKKSSLLLIPYFLWVSFIAYLNYLFLINV
ncbi:MAG: TspO/MBR family protein [Candidatus Pacearchaeota archaeon]